MFEKSAKAKKPSKLPQKTNVFYYGEIIYGTSDIPVSLNPSRRRAYRNLQDCHKEMSTQPFRLGFSRPTFQYCQVEISDDQLRQWQAAAQGNAYNPNTKKMEQRGHLNPKDYPRFPVELKNPPNSVEVKRVFRYEVDPASTSDYVSVTDVKSKKMTYLTPDILSEKDLDPAMIQGSDQFGEGSFNRQTKRIMQIRHQKNEQIEKLKTEINKICDRLEEEGKSFSISSIGKREKALGIRAALGRAVASSKTNDIDRFLDTEYGGISLRKAINKHRFFKKEKTHTLELVEEVIIGIKKSL